MPAARSRDRRAYISYPPPMPRELSNWFCPFRKTSHIYELYLHYDSSSRLRYEAPKEKSGVPDKASGTPLCMAAFYFSAHFLAVGQSIF